MSALAIIRLESGGLTILWHRRRYSRIGAWILRTWTGSRLRCGSLTKPRSPLYCRALLAGKVRLFSSSAPRSAHLKYAWSGRVVSRGRKTRRAYPGLQSRGIQRHTRTLTVPLLGHSCVVWRYLRSPISTNSSAIPQKSWRFVFTTRNPVLRIAPATSSGE